MATVGAGADIQQIWKTVVQLGVFITDGDVQGLRAAVEDIGARLPNFWQESGGRFCLRYLTMNAVRDNHLPIVKYLCGERGVPPVADMPDDEVAFALSPCFFAQGGPRTLLPLREASHLGHEDIRMYLLSLTGAEEDLGRRLGKGNSTLCQLAAMRGNMAFLRALVERGVDFDVSDDLGFTALYIAVKHCNLPMVRFLFKHYKARGMEAPDVLRDVAERAAKGERASPMLIGIIRYKETSDEAKLAMVASLVQEAGADIWAEGIFTFVERTTFVNDDDKGVGQKLVSQHLPYLPLHAAAMEGNQAVLDFFLTECGMPANARVSSTQFTVLHFLMMSERDETDLLPIVRWLVGKGVDTTCRENAGHTAAEMAAAKGRTRIQMYLEAQEARQKTRKAKEKEEQKKKAAAAVVSAARVREMENAMAALLLELEAEP